MGKKLMDFEEWFEQEFSNNRYNYEQDLIENGYSPSIVSEVNDGRDERLQNEYNIYLTN